MIDRSAINRALAKAIAYQQCGDLPQAEGWARELVKLLQMHRILKGYDPTDPAFSDEALYR